MPRVRRGQGHVRGAGVACGVLCLGAGGNPGAEHATRCRSPEGHRRATPPHERRIAMKIVVVGLGAAGANAARTMAAAGRPEVQVEVYGAEPHLYYARPKLPAYLAGEIPL